jgi:hypothetical protein
MDAVNTPRAEPPKPEDRFTPVGLLAVAAGKVMLLVSEGKLVVVETLSFFKR